MKAVLLRSYIRNEYDGRILCGSVLDCFHKHGPRFDGMNPSQEAMLTRRSQMIRKP